MQITFSSCTSSPGGGTLLVAGGSGLYTAGGSRCRRLGSSDHHRTGTGYSFAQRVAKLHELPIIILPPFSPYGETRETISQAVETEVLTQSGRRCGTVCFALHQDTTVKGGQIAHLDQDPSNNGIENLCFLCLIHHDQYDSRSSQTKGLTENEVRSYRDRLYAALPGIGSGTPRKAGDVSVAGNLAAGSGGHGPGGDVRVEGGTGRHGASGGNVTIGLGTHQAGAGGDDGKGGDLIIKGGDAE